MTQGRAAWVSIIQKARAAGIRVILLTLTADARAKLEEPNDPLNQHAGQIRELAAEYHVALVDSLARFKAEIAKGVPLDDLLSQSNHPNARGHGLVVNQLQQWFPPTR